MIHFGPADAQGVHLPHNDALVISTTVVNYTVQRIFLDSGSSIDILFYKVYQQIEIGDILLEPVDTLLHGFAGEVVHPLRQILLPLSSGTEPTRSTRMLKFPIGDKVGEVEGDQYTTCKCYVEAVESSSGRMEVDPPSKESSRCSTQQDDQKGIVPARVQPAGVGRVR
ncbi:UNVERIFIED_CONTAM: hypothetical protein Sradi_6537900 [Sesamum radiatum]|uniref:Uncharacterized protein n=1 Tax=Sesamum radiatum TaxID=300843 RepID=A0AAW2JYZ0_SESRA